MALLRQYWKHAQWNYLRKFSASQIPEMPACNHEPCPYKGESYDTVKATTTLHTAPCQVPFYKKPLLIHEGFGQWLWDHEGKRYLDMFAGVATVSVGHSHPKIISAVLQQMNRLGHTTPIYMQPRLQEYVKKLVSKMPGDLSVVYLVNSGSEATELAFLMARLYTGAHEIVSLKNCYHGGSHTAAASTALSTWRYPVNSPSGHIHVTNPDVYHGPWGGSRCRDSPIAPGNRKCQCTGGTCFASDKYFEQIKDVFKFSLPNNGRVAAFIAESIQGVGGTIQFPRSYLSRVYEFIRYYGGVCIADEVQTGFGRTGEYYWGFQGHGVEPDIVTMGKGIGNGFPMGAVVTRPAIANTLKQALHFNTFGGNPIACSVGSAVLDIIEEEQLQENAFHVGTHLLERLGALQLYHPTVIGDVRGKGLMIGVELVCNPETREPLPPSQMIELFEEIKDMGVLVGKGGLHANVLRIKPPLCVTKADADFTVEVINKAIQNLKHRYSYNEESVYCNGV
ncbi:alanine--glyoxylate aminotransferase 2 homolog 1, mitochondrial [Athalia rosae]|uniref:alanine--glyoxylate aminotransferase 2 homolog 1, mitochondrial n=1 Tax=Athalia rosae TaxID=37344 RepID=UPI000626CF1B|nr:alanine--glyoxylate aminotransferase 2 homolog 1, mitochondrial [Athalia rosae]